jgi:hypothetical protein
MVCKINFLASPSFKVLLFVLLFSAGEVFGQSMDTSVVKYHSTIKFSVVTYNASNNPNLCMEAVEHGLYMSTGLGKEFFSIGYIASQKIGEYDPDRIYEVEVQYYNAPDTDSGAAGCVEKIIYEGKVLYDVKDSIR